MKKVKKERAVVHGSWEGDETVRLLNSIQEHLDAGVPWEDIRFGGLEDGSNWVIWVVWE